MSLAVACAMPLVMMGMLLFLARIEERHLTARPALAVIPAPAEDEQATLPDHA